MPDEDGTGAGASPVQMTGGTGGTGATRDDPFGFGPTECDKNPNVGGDACRGWIGIGFFTEPSHLTTNLAASNAVRVLVTSEFTPSTAFKQAMETGVSLRAFGSDTSVPIASTWEVERDRLAVILVVKAQAALAPGWYSLFVPRAAREAHGAPYSRSGDPRLFQGGYPIVTDGKDLRADFRVGSQPLVARISLTEAMATVEFTETVRSEAPPVKLAIGDYDPACSPSEWSGAGTQLSLACEKPLRGYDDPVNVTISPGFVTADGTPLRGPNGQTNFMLAVPEAGELQLGVPADER